MRRQFLHIIYVIDRDIDKFPDCPKIPYFYSYNTVEDSKRALQCSLGALKAMGYTIIPDYNRDIFHKVKGTVYIAKGPSEFPSYVITIQLVAVSVPPNNVFLGVTNKNTGETGAILNMRVFKKIINDNPIDESVEYEEDTIPMTPERVEVLNSIYSILDKDDAM